MAFDKLFEPIQIGPVKIKNRYAYAPTNWCFFSWDGLMNEQELAYYTARAMGGTGLMIYGAILSTEFGVPYMQHPWIFCFDVSHVPGLSMMAENIRLAGAVPIIQLLPVPRSSGQNWKGVQPVAPSAGLGMWAPPYKHRTSVGLKMIDERLGEKSWTRRGIGSSAEPTPARELTLDEIQTIIKQHAHACRLAAYAGFDGVEVHACHNYLVSTFRNPRMNQRKDRYGGSEENRNRLVLELAEASIRAAKEENPNMAVGIRLDTVVEYEGFDFEETKRLALQLQELGIDYYHATGGPPPVPGQKRKDGALLEYTKELTKILKVPVITPSVREPELAEQAVVEGWTDMVSTAHPMIADPEFVNKVKENRLKDINKCTACGLCQVGDPMGIVLPARCSVNPEVGFERYNPKYQIRQGFTKAKMLPYVLRKKQYS